MSRTSMTGYLIVNGVDNCNIPSDLVEAILILLPVKSLRRFQCVCKSWNSFIGTRNFKLKHYTYHSKLTHQNDYCDDFLITFKRQAYTLESSFSGNHESYTLESFKLPVDPQDGWPWPPTSTYWICAVSYGIVLVSIFFLWNPATGVTVNLPLIPFDFERSTRSIVRSPLTVYGLCFDPVTEDYKVISTIRWNEEDQSLCTGGSLYLYSSKTSSWKLINARLQLVPERPQKSMHLFGRDTASVSAYFDGCFYWLANECDYVGSDSSVAIIIEFNSVTEAFKVALLPETIKNITPTPRATLNIAVHKGSLMLLNCYYVSDGPKKVCDIWVMIGEDDSGLILWERKLFVDFEPGELEVHPRILKPKGLRRMANGQTAIIFESYKQLLWYDPSTETFNVLMPDPPPKRYETNLCYGALPYVESLFDIKVPNPGIKGFKADPYEIQKCRMMKKNSFNKVMVRDLFKMFKKLFSSC